MATTTTSPGDPDINLDLDPPKKNVFVTQLQNRDEEYDEVAPYPVVNDPAGKLLETGVNTLQRTLLLKKEVEIERVDEELQAKRDEFKKRMEGCAEKQVSIQQKQQQMKDLVVKFEKYIRENEGKRRRAIQKYQMEVKLKEQKINEHEKACQMLNDLKDRQNYLRIKLKAYKIYEMYLNKVIDILPPHYLEVNDSMLSSLMMRHHTLAATNQTVVDNLQTMVEQLEEAKQRLEDMRQDHNKSKVYINSQLSQMQNLQEVSLNRNHELEQVYTRGKRDLRAQRAEVGQIMMAIDNLAEKCRQRMDPALDNLTVESKLEIIKEYLVERCEIVRIATRLPEGSSSPVSDRRYWQVDSRRTATNDD